MAGIRWWKMAFSTVSEFFHFDKVAAAKHPDTARPSSAMTTQSPVERFGIRKHEDVDYDTHVRIKFDPIARKMIVEFIGTIIYVFIGK